jgi:hypothetical protein
MDRKTSGRIGKDQCRFCHKTGHFQVDCRKYKKAQAAVLKKKDDTDEERINIVRDGQRIEDESSLCSWSTKRSVNSIAEYVKTATILENWIVDSGATRHFSSFRGDFGPIKRWSTPKIVRVADGIIYNVKGYGSVTINTTYGPYELDEVWYAPNLCSRLVSASMLNDRGVSVIFEN